MQESILLFVYLLYKFDEAFSLCRALQRVLYDPFEVTQCIIDEIGTIDVQYFVDSVGTKSILEGPGLYHLYLKDLAGFPCVILLLFYSLSVWEVKLWISVYDVFYLKVLL